MNDPLKTNDFLTDFWEILSIWGWGFLLFIVFTITAGPGVVLSVLAFDYCMRTLPFGVNFVSIPVMAIGMVITYCVTYLVMAPVVRAIDCSDARKNLNSSQSQDNAGDSSDEKTV